MSDATPTLPMVKVQYNVPKAMRMPRSDVLGRKLVSASCQITKSTKLIERMAKERRKSKFGVSIINITFKCLFKGKSNFCVSYLLVK